MKGTTKKRYYGYARESVDLASGIELQKETITRWSVANDCEIIDIIEDNNASAGKQRPKFERLMESLSGSDGIVVASLDRFGRSFSNILCNIEKLKEKGYDLVCIREGINTSNKQSELFLKLFALLAEYERLLIKERLMAGLQRARDKGSKSGKPCHRPEIKIDWKEYDKWKSKQLGVASIAKILNVNVGTLYSRARLREAGIKQKEKGITI